jgi:uncharacterized low-complexity protein
MKNSRKTPFALAVGASILPFAATVAQADSNPFSLSELSAAYMQTAEAAPATTATDKAKAGSCGEGKCGASMNMPKPAADANSKAVEKKCAANMPAAPATSTTPAK